MTVKVCTDVAVLCWIEAHPALAGWFQAIFSVAAIVVAITIPWAQHRMAVAREQAKVDVAVKRLCHSCSAIYAMIVKTAQKPSADRRPRMSYIPFEVVEAASIEAARVSDWDLTDFDLTVALHNIATQLRRTEQTLKVAAQGDNDVSGEGWGPVFVTQQERMAAHTSAALKRLHHNAPRAMSLKSLPAWARTTWTARFKAKA